MTSVYEYYNKSKRIVFTYRELNHLIALVTSGLSASSRWSGSLDLKYEHLLTNIIPYPDVNMVKSYFVIFVYFCCFFSIQNHAYFSKYFTIQFGVFFHEFPDVFSAIIF